ncbi:hypothetical protein KUTeg_019551 [Tegillarca granosa]|uniref:Protein FAN n=1 Tax=Tegillarca granosa TaxID=220873 RepID=A0ABQ9EDB0_TEGGR|nr:hypothetical protein KUTeg_019551 [Tegillarca granosa]
MSFLENDTAAQERFNLLLLEPGEIYFEDFSVFYYPNSPNKIKDTDRKHRGHLKICSKSIVFVPKESAYPILKFPLKYVKDMNEWSSESLFSKHDVKDKGLKIVSDQVVEMKAKNIISPYVFSREPSEHRFTLNYVAVDDCLPQMCQLHRASTLPPAEQSAMINAIVLSRQSRVKFNTSWLEDLYEKIILETQGDRISPLVTNPGRIMLTNRRLYFQPFNNIESMPVIKIRLKDIRRIIKRRFLLKPIGLEIFCKEYSPCTHIYLSMKSHDARNQLYDQILEQPDINLEDTGQEDMTIKWLSGHITNYDYLLYLNSVADRSFSDLTQYPVMPWVVSDWTSQYLDLDNPDTFRDLSKPIGALNPERLERMKERYTDMPEPKFLYGSHYSTPGYVLFYLARIAPEYVLCLQNGKFDKPDRMFNNLYDTWQNCLQGAADFKELIPEFYSGNAEFLLNNGITYFGIRQDGRPVGDVELPPWAKDHVDFLNKLKTALECKYVSENLHHWIDLIFGYKQRGEEAEKADNVFYYMTYEGAIDLDSITDPNERACMEIQIMEFGQVPKQLFKTPHPQRFSSMPLPSVLVPQLSVVESTNESPDTDPSIDNNVEIQAQSESNKTEPVELNLTSDLTGMDGTEVVGVSSLQMSHSYLVHKGSVTDMRLSHDGKYIFSVSQDSLLKMYSLEDQRQLRSINLSKMALSSCLIMPDDKTIIVSSWDNSVYFYSIEFGRILDTLMAHDDAVSHVNWKNNVLMTSSWDSTVKVWNFTPPGHHHSFTAAEFVGQLDHDSGVSCQFVDDNCTILVTGTKEGMVYIWDMNTLYPIAEHSVHSGNVNAVLLSTDCRRLLSCGDDCYLRVMDIETGTEIFVKDLHHQLLCLRWNGHLLVAGSDTGQIQFWDIEKAQLQHTISAHDGKFVLEISQLS